MLSSISVMASANYKEADNRSVVFIFNRTWCNSGSALNVSYQLFGTAQSGSDFTGNTTGTITFAAGSFTSTLSLPVLTQGTLIDSHKTIIARINPAAEYEIATGEQFATSTITNESQPLPPTYTITQSTASISESSILTTSVSTSNVAIGNKLYFALSGIGITASDFSAGAFNGEGSIDTAGKFTFTHTLAYDLTTEGLETLEIKLFSDSERLLQLGPTSTVTIADTSTKDSTTFAVTALNGKYFINGENRDAVTLNLLEGNVYIFDQSNASNANHLFQFSTTSNGTHGGGEQYTRGVITSGIPGTIGAFTKLTLEPGASTLYYFCNNHSGMGGQINTNDINSIYTYYSSTTNNALQNWNIIFVDNLVVAEDIVSQWFGTAAAATQQIQDISDTKLMDVVATTWADKVQINRVAKATNAGGKIEAKQINFGSGEVAGSVVSGGIGNDDIKGYAGWDFLDGGAGDDLIHGGNGRDTLTGGAGRDELHGDFGWNTYKDERDGVSDLIAIKSDHYLVNWLYGKAGNSPNGEKSDIIEGLDAIDKIRIIGVDTSEITFAANVITKGVTGIGIYGKGILEALYTGGDLTVAQITQMTSGDASAAAMSNSIHAYGVW